MNKMMGNSVQTVRVRMYQWIVAFVLLVIVLTPSITAAETVLRVGESVSLADDQVVEGDFYAAAGPVSLSGVIEGDAHIAGGSVTTNGSIGGDLFVAGGAVQVHASVTDDVRVMGGEVTIAESVGGDVFVLGGVLTVLSSADIGGNVFFYGGEAEINGTVHGHVYGAAEALRVDGVITRGIDISIARSLVLGERADIGGDVRYESPYELVRAQNAVVVGNTIHNTAEAEEFRIEDTMVPLILYAFSTLVFFALLRNRLGALMDSAYTRFTHNGLIGLAGVVCLPIIASLLFVTVIGIVVGLTGLLATLVLYLLAFALVPIFVGTIIERLWRKTSTMALQWTLLGIVATELLLFVPVIGPVFLFVGMVVISGAMLLALYTRLVP